MKKSYLYIGIIFIISFLLISCGGSSSSSGPSEPTAAELTAEGWTAFETGDYSIALSKFEEALSTDSSYYYALLGKGFTYFLDPAYLEEDGVSFLETEILGNVNSVSDSVKNAGLSLIVLHRFREQTFVPGTCPLYSNVYDYIYDLTPTWEFSHNNGDINIIAAMVHLKFSHMFIYIDDNSTDSNGIDDGDGITDYLEYSKMHLDYVLNLADFGDLSQDIQDYANDLKTILQEKNLTF